MLENIFKITKSNHQYDLTANINPTELKFKHEKS